MRRLKTLDLFSGIGGFAIGLRQVSRVVAYCENNPDCKAVLLRAMSTGKIDQAPIHPDIRELRGGDIRCHPEMITAGSPCQDFSALISPFRGCRADRSDLVWQIIRLIEELPSVRYVMIENAPTVMSRGLSVFLGSLADHGFRIVFSNFSAAEIGAPHERNRFFCFAIKAAHQKDDNELFRMPVCDIPLSRWPNEPRFRLIPRTICNFRDLKRRWRLLGNSVVPMVVSIAYNTLSRTLLDYDDHAYDPPLEQNDNFKKVTLFTKDREDYRLISIRTTSPYRRDRAKVDIITGPFQKNMWATPVSQTYGNCRRITERCSQNLSNQVYYELQSILYLRSRGEQDISTAYRRYIINPCFVEYLMGFPQAYTRF